MNANGQVLEIDGIWIDTLRQSKEALKLEPPRLHIPSILHELDIALSIHIRHLLKHATLVKRLPCREPTTTYFFLPCIVHEEAEEELCGLWVFRT